MTPVVVKRSALKMWLMAMGAIPLLILSLDVLINRRLTNQLREIVFRPEDTQIFEPRDVIWAWALAIFAGLLVLWGLKELFLPTRVVECSPEGLGLKLTGPFKPNTVVPWNQIIDVDGIEVEDEGEKIPLFWMELTGREGLPENPWGARWVGERELVLLAQDWPEPPREVAEAVADYAVEEAKRPPQVAELWSEGAEEE